MVSSLAGITRLKMSEIILTGSKSQIKKIYKKIKQFVNSKMSCSLAQASETEYTAAQSMSMSSSPGGVWGVLKYDIGIYVPTGFKNGWVGVLRERPFTENRELSEWPLTGKTGFWSLK